MAIGSAPEIGTQFSVGVWSRKDMAEWRKLVGSDGQGGYATLAYPDPTTYHKYAKDFPQEPYTRVDVYTSDDLASNT